MSTQGRPRGRLDRAMRQAGNGRSGHPIVVFIAIAFAPAWASWAWLSLQGAVVTAGGEVTHFPGLFAPALGAVVATAALGRHALLDLARGIVRWRVPVRWYALAFLPVGLFGLGLVATAATGGQLPSVEELSTYSGLPQIGLAATVLLVLLAAFGEEIGWRGFLQPALRTRSAFLPACLLVAAVWVTWHLPLVAVIESYRALGAGAIAMLVVGLGSGAIILGWLYERSGGSILLVAVFHAGLNLSTATVAAHGLPAALTTTGVILAAVIIAVREALRGRTLVRSPHPQPVDEPA